MDIKTFFLSAKCASHNTKRGLLGAIVLITLNIFKFESAQQYSYKYEFTMHEPLLLLFLLQM